MGSRQSWHDFIAICRRGAPIAGVLLLALAMLVGCRTQQEPLRVGVLAWPPYDLARLAIDREILSKNRFDLLDFQTPSEVVRSFRYGLIDAMFVTSHFALTTLRELDDVRIIYIVDVSLGGDALLARPGIDSGEALKNARVGVEVAPLGIYTLVRALGELGLTREDVEVVNIDTPDQFDAWQSGSVDAMVTYEPTRSLIKNTGAVELFNSEAIPYEILDVLVVRDAVIEQNRNRLVDFLEGLDGALAAYRQDPDATAALMAERHRLTPPEFREAMASVRLFDLADNLAMLTDDQHPVLEGLLQQCRVMVEAGMLVSIPDLEPLIDATLVEQAMAR